MKFVSLEGSETGTFLKPSFIFCNYNEAIVALHQADIYYVNKLHSCLSALHIQSLGGVASLHELAGDGVEGPRALVQLLDRVELQGLSRVVDQKSVSLNNIRVRLSEELCVLSHWSGYGAESRSSPPPRPPSGPWSCRPAGPPG